VVALTSSEHDEEAKVLDRTVKIAALGITVALVTVACGERPVDRALTGGAIGAASGAVVGSTVGAPVGGALIGGAAGATIGAVTAPERPYYYY
jgi:hypothetical protein